MMASRMVPRRSGQATLGPGKSSSQTLHSAISTHSSSGNARGPTGS